MLRLKRYLKWGVTQRIFRYEVIQNWTCPFGQFERVEYNFLNSLGMKKGGVGVGLQLEWSFYLVLLSLRLVARLVWYTLYVQETTAEFLCWLLLLLFIENFTHLLCWNHYLGSRNNGKTK